MASDKVLLVCYYFPPLGAAGAGRPFSLFKYLPDYGIDCDILTVKNVAYRHYEPELLDGIDLKRIYRAGSTDPQRLLYLLGMRKMKDKIISKGKAVSDRYFPDPKVGWVKPAVKLGRVLTENKKYKVIISTSPPISAHLIAIQLAKEFHIPWIADFRDYWVSHKVEDWFSDAKKINKGLALLENIKSKATVVTSVSKNISAYLGSKHVIYNSFDRDRAHLWKPPEKKSKFKIGILGTIDDLRPIDPLFKLLSLLKQKNNILFQEVELIQVGDIIDREFDNKLLQYELSDICKKIGIKTKVESIEILNETSMLYIGLSSECSPGVITSRFFDMVASGRPILASVPANYELAELIDTIGNGLCFDDNFEQAVNYLVDKISNWQNGTLNINPLPDYSMRFSSSNMTEAFVRLLKTI